MPERKNGGVFSDQVLTGSLIHFKIIGADFSGAVDSQGKPVYNSAADIVAREISKKATIAILDPVSQKTGMSIALETNRAGWNAETMQAMIRSLGSDVGVDHLNLSNIKVEEVPYDLIGTGSGTGGASTFLDLFDTPSSYVGQANKHVVVNSTENGLVFQTEVPPIDTFLELTDTPNSYAGQQNKTVVVNPTGTGLLFSDPIVTNETKFIVAVPNQVLVPNKKYIADVAMTLTLPDYTTLVEGDSITIMKAVSANSIFVQTSSAQIIDTDIGSDTAIEIDVSNVSVFVYDGTHWSLGVASIKSVGP